jgi:hypothetical protein
MSFTSTQLSKRLPDASLFESPLVVANRPGADAIPAMTEFIQQPLALRLT